MYNKLVSLNKIEKYDENINNDSLIPQSYKENPTIREVCRAGLWLAEELEKLGCHNILICRIQWTAGKLSFGRNIWEVHEEILEKYKNNTLIFEEDLNEIKS